MRVIGDYALLGKVAVCVSLGECVVDCADLCLIGVVCVRGGELAAELGGAVRKLPCVFLAGPLLQTNSHGKQTNKINHLNF